LGATIFASARWRSGERRSRTWSQESTTSSSAQLEAEGVIVFAHACQLGLEGIVSKRAGSRYRSGASRNWLKCLSPEFQRR
jgi:ATP-dependent DNA ligase